MSNEEKRETLDEVAETEITSGVGVYKLRKPTKIDGNIVSELSYNLDSLTGSDIKRIRTALGKRGYIVTAKEIDSVLHAAIFAEASGLTMDNIEALNAFDYMNVADIVRDFLLGED